MDSTTEKEAQTGGAHPIPFKAETRQLLDILIHSLYTEREIFLRELISNASDALTRMDFELLTNRQVLNPETELSIRITPNEDERTLTITDSGVGMTGEEMIENLGTIAHSGARAFMQAAQEAAKDSGKNLSNIIGQFGVGFYSAFMVAESIRVISRSYHPDSQAAAWFSSGEDTYTLEQAEKAERGTSVIIKLKEDAVEFTKPHRLREIIKKHSDFIPFPIYIGDEQEQVNRQTALWRQQPRQVEAQEYDEFYKQLTLDYEAPLAHAHMVVDAPVQMYALLFVPSDPERSFLTLRREPGLKLYARKVLIQEFNKDLLPEFLGFVQGVVDSEDLPLNVSRESVQSNRVMAQLKKLVTSKVIDMLKGLEPDRYVKFWQSYSRYIKHGIAIEHPAPEELYLLLRFRTTTRPDEWSSLDDYVGQMKPGQEKIYYILGDDERSLMHSPHLDIVRKYDYEVLLLTDPVDPLMLVRLHKFGEHELENVATSKLETPKTDEGEQDEPDELPKEGYEALIERFKTSLGDRVSGVRMTDRLTDSPARLVDPEGTPNQEMQRVFRLLNKEFEAPKKTLELNPRHPILVHLHSLSPESLLSGLIIEQVYEDALLIEGLHPDPAGMIERIQKIMEAALNSPTTS